MDKQTLQFYAGNSLKLVEQYNSCIGGISVYFKDAFCADMKILDIGCGSGRDLCELRRMGFDAYGVDACKEFVELVNENLCSSVVSLASLPELSEIADNSYDGVLCSAVLMHLPEEELFDAAFSIRRIMTNNGRLLLSIPLYDSTINPETKRDADGRLFNGVTPEQLQLLFKRIGFRLLNRWVSDDSLNREHRKWATMLFELESKE
jgi:2-polyprenyl-3-methyl-5-hydroxy-6-metoxy-1,4-benzoquinol methylase